jgi:hypothetical protein
MTLAVRALWAKTRSYGGLQTCLPAGAERSCRPVRPCHSTRPTAKSQSTRRVAALGRKTNGRTAVRRKGTGGLVRNAVVSILMLYFSKAGRPIWLYVRFNTTTAHKAQRLSNDLSSSELSSSKPHRTRSSSEFQ